MWNVNVEKKMENEFLRAEEGFGMEIEYCYTLVNKKKPSSNSGTIGNFATTWQEGKRL